MAMTLCTICAINEVPFEGIEVDPICKACTLRECPGYGTGEDCGGEVMTGSDLCSDCHMARCDVESPRIPL